MALSVTLFVYPIKYLGNRWTELRQIHREDVFGPSLGRVWMSRSKVNVIREKRHFWPFRRPVRGLCLVKHLSCKLQTVLPVYFERK